MQLMQKRALKNRKGNDFYGEEDSHAAMCGLWRNEEQEGNDAGLKDRGRSYCIRYDR